MGAARDPSLLEELDAIEDSQDVPPALKEEESQGDLQTRVDRGGLLEVVTRCVCVCVCMYVFCVR